MASNRSILVYWTQENNWSILKENCIKEGSLTKGSAVQAYYLRKVYPAILIAISENKSSIERIETHFKKFLLGVNTHVDDEEMIKKIKNEFIPFMIDTQVESTKKVATPRSEKKLDGLVPEVPSMTEKPLLSTPKKLTPKKSAATPEKMAPKMTATPKKMAPKTTATPKKMAPKTTATPNKMTPEKKTTPNKKSSKMDGLVPQMKGSNEGIDYLRKESESNISRDRHIRKLEEDVKVLKEDNKYLRRKVRKLEERNSLREENGEIKQQSGGQDVKVQPSVSQDVKQPSANDDCSSVSVDQEVVTVDDIKKSVQHLKFDQDIFKVLCLKIFTKDELKSSSRTGKKTIKCGDTARPPLDVQKLTKLELLVLQCTAMDKTLFYKKLENFQKILRRS